MTSTMTTMERPPSAPPTAPNTPRAPHSSGTATGSDAPACGGPDELTVMVDGRVRALGSVPTERLEAEVCELSAHIDAALCRWLLLVGELDRRDAWAAWECRSGAHWLSWKCGISLSTAREHVRVARALHDLPVIRAEFARGALSFSKVRALTRVADASTDAPLAALAHDLTGAGCEAMCRAYRRHGTGPTDDEAAAAYEQRELRHWWDDDGSLRFMGRLPADLGAVVVAALQAAVLALDDHEQQPDQPEQPEQPDLRDQPGQPERADRAAAPASGRRAGAPERLPIATRRADALVALCESFLATGLARRERADAYDVTVILGEGALTGAVTSRAPAPPSVETAPAGRPVRGPAEPEQPTEPAQPAEPVGRAERPESADPADAVEYSASAGSPRDRRTAVRGVGAGCADPSAEVAHLEGGPALASAVAARLACDCHAVAAVLGSDGDPLYVSAGQRLVSRRLRRALRLRDQTCRFPGCDHRGFLDAHHIEHWAAGGPTVPENLLLLCAKHHRAVHEGGFRLRLDDHGQVEVRDPRGVVLRPTPPPPDAGAVERANRAAGLRIDAGTNACGWEGRSAGLSDIVAYLDHHARAGAR